jgi:hypothetical protein
MELPSIPDILARIEAFCRRHDMAESRFGREAVNNPALVSSLRGDDPNPTIKTLERVAQFMAEKDAEADQDGGLEGDVERDAA